MILHSPVLKALERYIRDDLYDVGQIDSNPVNIVLGVIGILPVEEMYKICFLFF